MSAGGAVEANLIMLGVAIVFFGMWLLYLTRGLAVVTVKTHRFAGVESKEADRAARNVCFMMFLVFAGLFATTTGAARAGLVIIALGLIIFAVTTYRSPNVRRRVVKHVIHRRR